LRSTSESDRLSALGDELVSKSLEEVTGNMRAKSVASEAATLEEAEAESGATPRLSRKVTFDTKKDAAAAAATAADRDVSEDAAKDNGDVIADDKSETEKNKVNKKVFANKKKA
jgi:hypothetical protein